MKPVLKRLTVRSVHSNTVQELDDIQEVTRLPRSLLIEEAIDLLWDRYEADGFFQDEEFESMAKAA